MIIVTKIETLPGKSIKLLKAVKRRKGAIIFNDSNRTIFLKLGTPGSKDDWSLSLYSNSIWEIPKAFAGRIFCYCPDGSNGFVRVTEMR